MTQFCDHEEQSLEGQMVKCSAPLQMEETIITQGIEVSNQGFVHAAAASGLYSQTTHVTVRCALGHPYIGQVRPPTDPSIIDQAEAVKAQGGVVLNIDDDDPEQ